MLEETIGFQLKFMIFSLNLKYYIELKQNDTINGSDKDSGIFYTFL